MLKKKKILILCYSNLNSDPRVLGQYRTLKDNYEVYTAGYSSIDEQPSKNHINIGMELEVDKSVLLGLPFLFLKVYRALMYKYICATFNLYYLFYWDIGKFIDLVKLRGRNFDLIIVNDIETLPLALSIGKNTLVHFDAHEYAPLEYENDERWVREIAPFKNYLCQKYIPKTSYRTTEVQELPVKYKELTRMDFDVIFNAPDFLTLPAKATSEKQIRFIHHGLASPKRKIESMIEAFKSLGPQYELNLSLMKSDPNY